MDLNESTNLDQGVAVEHVVREVGLVTPAWPAGAMPNGIASYVSRLGDALVKQGVGVTVMARDVGVDAPQRLNGESGLEVLCLRDAWTREKVLPRLKRRLYNRMRPRGMKQRGAALLLLDTLALVRQRRPIDLVQIEESDGLALPLFEHSRDYPVVVRLHGPWFLNGAVSGWAQDRVFQERVDRERDAIAQADAITAPSMDVLQRTRDYYGLALPNAAVIPNPVDFPEPSDCWQASKADPNRLLFVGRFDLHKGGDLVIRAFTELAKQRPNLKLDFVGKDLGLIGADGRKTHLPEYVDEVIREADIRDRLVVHGKLDAQAVARMRLKAGVTIVASRYETFGNVALECLAAGVPAVVAAAGGLNEVVDDGETAVTFEPDDLPSMVSAIGRVLDDAVLRDRLSSQGREIGRQRFNGEAIARQTLNFYETVVKRYRAEGRH